MKNSKNKKQEIKLVYLEWLDHWSDASGTWLPFEGLDQVPVKCKSVGFLVSETELVYTLSINMSSTNKNGGPLMHILKSCVVVKKWLK